MNPATPLQSLMNSFRAVTKFIRKMNEYDNPDVNRTKAAKYENLLAILTLQLQNPPQMAPEYAEKLEEISSKYKQLSQGTPGSIDYLETVRSLYRDCMIPFLRDLVTKSADLELQQFAKRICYSLHTENDLSLNTELVLRRFRPKEEERDLLQRLKLMKAAIDTAPSSEKAPLANRLLRSLKDYYDQGFSPINSGNPVQIFSFMTFFGGKLKVLAMGSPTIQTSYVPLLGSGEAAVDPLFLGYLEELGRRRERHLYLSFQDMGAEGARNSLLMGLQYEERFKECFLAITCSKNSPFYYGRGHPEDGDQFIKQLHAQFFDGQEAGCFLPNSLRHCGEKSLEILQFLKGLFLSDIAILEERLAVIDFYYVLLASWVCLEMKVDYINFTCKDAIDRGMQSLAEFTLLWSTVQGNIVESESFAERMEEILFARAYYVRKRSMLPERFHRFISNAGVFLSKMQDPMRKETFCMGVRKIFNLEECDVASLH